MALLGAVMGILMKIWRNYISDSKGHFAVQFALLGLPLIVATTFVTDYTAASGEKVNVKTALDAAVIAAVNNDALSLEEKENYARTHFVENYSGDIDFELTPEATENRVEMSAFGLSPVTVADTLGIKGIEIYESSAAVTASENVICVLSLADQGANRIVFKDNVKFLASTCSVHANSVNSSAIVSEGKYAPTAQSFCAAGGVKGDFSPYGKGECKHIKDPYEHVKPAPSGPCLAEFLEDTKKRGGKNDDDDEFDDDYDDDDDRDDDDEYEERLTASNDSNGRGNIDTTESLNLTGSFKTLYPGTYCGGLTVDGIKVHFAPGDYVMLDGKLTFKNGAEATAEDVTFTMRGKKATLKVEKDANVYIKAPRFGERKGLAFIQDPLFTKGKNNKLSKGKNEIKSGGELNVLGTLYFPTQAIKISGENSRMGAQAPATSFIAYEIEFAGEEGASVAVNVDHVAAGLPPMLPTIENGARLVE